VADKNCPTRCAKAANLVCREAKLKTKHCFKINVYINPLNAELNPTYHLLAVLGAHHILHVSRIRVIPGTDYFGLL